MKHSLVRLSFFLFVSVFIIVVGCKKSSPSSTTTTTTTTKHGTGWTGTDDPAKVPQAVNISGLVGASAALPSKVDLTPFTPPIGDQGQTSTCVGWSTGYYGKTISEAIANNYDHAKLSSANYEMSPKDMFLSIADNLKGSIDCQSGTQITDALDVLVNNGVATMATVPWNANITNCSQSQVEASWNADAANHKIVYYRTITATVQGIKEQLAANNPVLMGIKVSNEFENYAGGVITSATFPNPVGLHAQCIVGYDDSQGAGAFHVANSWGTGWGESGYYWIDYNTLVNQYISGGNVYYMSTSSSNNNVTPPTTTTTASVDIAPWVFSDASTYGNTTDDPSNNPTARKMWLNIYNIGQNSVDPTSTGWSYYYIYYNAFNANDYGVIFHDQFSTSIAANTYSCPNNNACTFNISIPAGSNFGSVAFNTPEIYRNYFVPNTLNGYYYLVLVADPQNALNDANRQNNIFYTTGQLPAAFANGITNNYNPNSGGIHDSTKNTLEVNEKNLRFSRFNSSIGERNKNAYTPEEILSFVKAKYLSGEIKKKVDAMKTTDHVKMPQVH